MHRIRNPQLIALVRTEIESGASAVLFDLDGTLLDSEPLYKRFEKRVLLEEFGVDVTPETLDSFEGFTLTHLLQIVEREYGVAIPRDEYLHHQKIEMTRLISSEASLFPDVVEILEWVRMRDDLQSALVTSSLRWYVDMVFDRFPSLNSAFGTVVTGDDVVHGKPNPEPYLLAASHLDVGTEDCVAIEDSENGILSAKAAGCVVVGVWDSKFGSL